MYNRSTRDGDPTRCLKRKSNDSRERNPPISGFLVQTPTAAETTRVAHVREKRVLAPPANRTVTIGPLVLLGLLGITFHLGARPRPRVETLEELSGRTGHGRPVGGNRRIITSATPEDASVPENGRPTHAKVGSTVPARGQAPGAPGIGKGKGEGQGVTGIGKSPAPPRSADLSASFRNSWIIHAGGGGGTGARQRSSTPRGRVKLPAGISSKPSLRSIWKAGPGDDTDPEQVNSKKD